MRRALVTAFGFLILSVVPIAPFFHLAVVPHRYCSSHHAFEEEHGSHTHSHHGQGPEDPEPEEHHDHESCLIANLLLQLFHWDPPLAILTNRLALQDGRGIVPHGSESIGQLDVVSLAPKTSPPA